jgi:hypothetical protein
MLHLDYHNIMLIVDLKLWVALLNSNIWIYHLQVLIISIATGWSKDAERIVDDKMLLEKLLPPNTSTNLDILGYNL